MTQQIIDITGNTYNYLTVIGFDHKEKIGKKNRTFWKCRCRCGKEKVLRKDTFIYPYSKAKSCGCWHIEESSKRPKGKNGKFIKKEDFLNEKI